MRFAALLLLTFATAAYAENEPTANWTPNPDPDSPEGVDNAGALPSADSTPEITFSGPTFDLLAVPTGGVVNSASVASVACSVNTISGGPPNSLSITSGSLFTMAKLLEPSTWTPNVTVTLACAQSNEPITGLLVCNQTPKFPPGRTIKTWWDVRCPAVNPPEWSSVPNNGTAINLTTTVGTPTTSTVTVTNTGASNLTVNPAALSGSLSVSGAGATATIAPGNSQGFTITCNPPSASTTNQTLSFATNDADEDPVTFPVQCVGTAAAAPEYVSTPAAGATISITAPVGGSNTSVLNIANSGNAALSGNISGLSGVLGIAPSALNLAAGANQNYTITCSPAAATTVVQTLTVTSNDADEGTNTYTVQCTGSAAPAPEFSSSPPGGSTISINAPVGGTNTSNVVVNNVGNATLNVTASIGGAPVFSVGPTGAQTVTAGNNRTFTITCAPTATGTLTQTLSFATNDSDEGNVTYSVNCTGQAPEFASSPLAPGPISLTGTAGGPDPTTTITVSNLGNANLVISSATGLNGDLGVQSPSFPQTILPGSNLVITIECDAGNAGSDSDVLSLDTNDADEDPVTFDVDCEIGPAGAADYFSNPADGGTIAITTAPSPATGSGMLEIRNVGGTDLAITSGTFTPAGGTTTEITASALPATLAAGASTFVTFTCEGAAPGSFSGTYEVIHDDAGESPASYTVDCTVANLPPDYGSSPSPNATIALSAIVGGSSNGTLTARNVGGGTLNVSAAFPVNPVLSVAPAGPTPITGGGSEALTLTCAPTATTTTAQTLTVTTDEAPGPNSYTYNVTCTGIAPAGGEFEASVPNGGTITINTTRGSPATQVLTVSNGGATNLTLTSVALGGVPEISFAPPLPTTPIALTPGLTRNINLQCQSATPGVFNDTLTIGTSDIDEPTVTFTIACVVADIPPDINTLQNPATPITINALLNAISTATITVQNTALPAGGTLNVSTSGLSSPLGISAPAGGVAAIPPQGQQNFTIQCAPQIVFIPPDIIIFQLGTFTQQLTFSSDDPDENTVNFTVTCEAGLAPQPEFGSAPDPGQTITLTTLPNVPVDAPIRVSNSGSLPDDVTPSLTGSPTIAIAPAALTPILPGAFQDFVITCSPTAVGTTTAVLTLASLDPDEEVNTYDVVCVADDPPEPELVTLPTSGFPIALTGLSGNQVTTGVGITNIGDFTLRVQSCSTVGAAFSLAATPTFPLDIAPADSAVVTIVCNVPPIGVPVTGSLTCLTSDSDEPEITFPLSCNGLTLPPTTVPGPRGPWLLVLGLALVALAARALNRRAVRVGRQP